MRIEHAKIFGFGKWVDHSIDFSKASGICIYGENESGKSTIQRFILFMLFGLPPKQRNFYRPKTSGRMGGRLTVNDTEYGKYTIERLDEVRNGAAVCYLPDGEKKDEEWLRERLHGMTLETYQAIFSFSATDLNDIKSMKEEELGEVILGIGLSGSSKIYQLEKRLDQRLAGLFKRYGTKPIINQQLETLELRFKELQQSKSKEASYLEKQDKKSELQTEITQLHESISFSKSELSKLERHIGALPLIYEYRQYLSAIQSEKIDRSFPEKGIERLQSLKQALLPMQSELHLLKENEAMYRRKLEDLQTQSPAGTIISQAEAVYSLKAQWQDDNQQLKKLVAMIEKVTIQIETELGRLNIGLEKEDLENLSFPFHIEKTWQEIKKQYEQLTFEQGKLKEEEHQLKQERNYLLNQIGMHEDGLLTDETYQDLDSLLKKHNEFHLLEKLKEEKDQERKSWSKRRKKKQEKSKQILYIFSLLAVISFIGTFLTDISQLMLAACLFALVGIGQFLWSYYSVKEMDKIFTEGNSLSNPSSSSVEERNRAEQLIQMHSKHQKEIAQLEEKLSNNNMNSLAWKEKEKALKEKEMRMNESIHTQYINYPFLRNLELIYWPELYHALKNVLHMERERKQQMKEIEEVKHRMSQISDNINEFFAEVNWTLSANMEESFKRIEAFLLKQDQSNRQMQQYEELLSESKEKEHQLRQKMTGYEQERDVLFSVAKVDSEEAFYHKSRMLDEQEGNEIALEKVKLQLENMLAVADLEYYVDNKLGELDLKEKKQHSMYKLDQLERELNNKREQLARVQAEIEAMESSSQYSDTLHQFEMETEKLHQLSKDWAVLKVAKEVLADTKRDYREKYLSMVIERTAFYFQHLTGGNYTKIFAPSEDKPFIVEAEDGIRYTINELSQGTVDQLYISLRLAISEAMSDVHQLPFIMDDAFVHFDSIRAQRMVEIMESISDRQQVLLFTCKNEVLKSCEKLYSISLNN
ncbi:ATP-binding protein [Oceanobacillus piezotolerans]|uniref:ATP-binding protein n=1 Tax=Oceanobacillus piezotolerans TaxID=2448030 RepID=UPI001313F974|nr:AAA family ATPase [Oceanobacillus piezotolerans]